jgi:hypothetical protein
MSCRYGRHRGERNERSALRRLASLIGVLTGPRLKLLPHSANARCTGDAKPITIDVRWIVLAKSYRLAALGWT